MKRPNVNLPTLPLPTLPPRTPEGHKGDFGRAILIGGSRGMSGAIALAGMSALRSGAGLVSLAVPDACLEVVAGYEPCYMTIPLSCDEAGRLTWEAHARLSEAIEGASCLGLGPGLGRSEDLTRLVCWAYRDLTQPVVIDADALNALAAAPETTQQHAAPRILTPHPGEFRRLVGKSDVSIDEMRQLAVELAKHSETIVVLKGHRTLITDGIRETYNTNGNPGMGTGGSGDVLTGIICALVCQELEPFDAAQLGVHVHGLAGDLAAEQLGQVSLTARDLVQFLPAAFQQLQYADI